MPQKSQRTGRTHAKMYLMTCLTKRYLFDMAITLLLTWSLFQISPACALRAGPKEKDYKDYNVLLITIDTLRADHLGCYGYEKVKTPNLDALAAQGVLFTQAVTPVPITLPAHSSIMTGQYPIQHGVRNNGNFILENKARTLAEILKENGCRTGACIGSFVLNSIFGLDQGFDFYEDKLPVRGKPTDILYNERNAGEITRLGLDWLKENGDRRFFLWLHYFDPHAAYSPPFPFARDYQKCPYDGEIAYTDQCLGDLIKGLDLLGLTNRTIIILTADHGESLGEHGEATHAIFIYESTLRIPLIIKGPNGLFPRGKKIQALVSNLDILPAVCDLFDIKQPPDLAGKSLLPLMYGKSREIHQEILLESLSPKLNFGWSRLEGVRKKDWKYIQAPHPEVYRLAIDPGEKKNLIGKEARACAVKDTKACNEKEAKIHSQLKDDLEKLKKSYAPDHESVKQVQMSRDVQDRLRSLGYVWTRPKGSEVKEGGGQDPKEMIFLIDYLDQGISYLYAHLYDQAMLCFQKIIQINPDNVSAHLNLGRVYQEKKLTDPAEYEFKKALSLNPDEIDAHNQLGLIYYQKGSYDLALAEFRLALTWAGYPEIHYNLSLTYDKMGKKDEAMAAVEQALQLDPNYLDAHNQAGNLFLNGANFDKAAAHFEAAIRIDPNHPSAYQNLGLVYNSQGKPELASQYCQKAIFLDPNNPEAHNNLGCVYLNQGRLQDALFELKKAVTLRPGYKNAMINLGMAYCGLKDYDLAKDIFGRAIEMDRDDADGYSQLGLLYLEKGDFPSALPAFSKVVTLRPDDPLAYYSLGKAQQGLGQTDQAIHSFEKALSLKTDLPGAHLNLGNAYFERNLIDKALEEWKIALAGKGIDLSTHLFNIGLAFSQRGEDAKAVTAWQKASDLDPENPALHYRLGAAYFRQGLYRSAYDEMIESVRLQPDNQEARSLLEKIGEIEGQQAR
ncbi:MAG: tetratricopeptide repeat protein [bacterium]